MRFDDDHHDNKVDDDDDLDYHEDDDEYTDDDAEYTDDKDEYNDQYANFPPADADKDIAGVDGSNDNQGDNDEDQVEAHKNHNQVEIAGVGDNENINDQGDNNEDQVEAHKNHDQVKIAGVGDNENVGNQDEVAGVQQNDAHDKDNVTNAEMDEKYGAWSGRYELRARKPRNYAHMFHQQDNLHLEKNDQHDTLVGAKHDAKPNDDYHDTFLETPQMNMKQGLKIFGEAGVDAVKKEMQQLHDRKVMQVKNPSKLTPEQKKEALTYLMFLKRKLGCADGRKQRAYTAKEDAASPTMATEAVFLTAIIDAMEGQEVAVFDVPGAFMQADMDELYTSDSLARWWIFCLRLTVQCMNHVLPLSAVNE